MKYKKKWDSSDRRSNQAQPRNAAPAATPSDDHTDTPPHLEKEGFQDKRTRFNSLQQGLGSRPDGSRIYYGHTTSTNCSVLLRQEYADTIADKLWEFFNNAPTEENSTRFILRRASLHFFNEFWTNLDSLLRQALTSAPENRRDYTTDLHELLGTIISPPEPSENERAIADYPFITSGGNLQRFDSYCFILMAYDGFPELIDMLPPHVFDAESQLFQQALNPETAPLQKPPSGPSDIDPKTARGLEFVLIYQRLLTHLIVGHVHDRLGALLEQTGDNLLHAQQSSSGRRTELPDLSAGLKPVIDYAFSFDFSKIDAMITIASINRQAHNDGLFPSNIKAMGEGEEKNITLPKNVRSIITQHVVGTTQGAQELSWLHRLGTSPLKSRSGI